MMIRTRAVNWYPLLFLCIPLLIYVWLVLPAINEGLPFFHREDEAHHFNRVVRMVKEGRLDPQYFHKPSLHFYLRMPVVAVSYLWEKHRGRAEKLSDINTYDPFGVADYAFSASHPAMVKWNRGFSAALNTLIIILTFLIGRSVARSNIAGFAAALLTAISPDMIENSAIVGVDTLMALMCLLCVYSALRLHKRFSPTLLWVCGLLAGLAVSSKYNAAPVAVLPVIVCLMKGKLSLKNLLIAVFAPAIGFLAGSPYVLFSLPLFVKQLSYEIWHYRVAGHVGNMAEPGLPQIIFYAKWISGHAMGFPAALAAAGGALLLALRGKSLARLFLAFPLLFFLLMVAQRANFTRNMIVLIPCLAVCAAAFSEWLAHFLKRTWRRILRPLATTALCLPPLFTAVSERALRELQQDSRTEAANWIESRLDSTVDTAVTGQLQFPLEFYRLPGVSRIDGKSLEPIELYLQGFDRLICGPSCFSQMAQLSYIREEAFFPGREAEERIVINPALRVYRFAADENLLSAIEERSRSRGLPGVNFGFSNEGVPVCYRGATPASTPRSESHCWLARRLEKINILAGGRKGKIHFKAMSPWDSQTLLFSAPGWQKTVIFSAQDSGIWKEIELSIPGHSNGGDIFLTAAVTRIHSPYEHGLSSDKRRLGVALRDLRLE